jgi:hypothetical protein
MFRAVRGAILDILNKINQADLLNRHEVKIPKREPMLHVNLQKLMLGAESKLHAIFSTDIMHQRAIMENYEQSDRAVFPYQGPSLKNKRGMIF